MVVIRRVFRYHSDRWDLLVLTAQKPSWLRIPHPTLSYRGLVDALLRRQPFPFNGQRDCGRFAPRDTKSYCHASQMFR